MSSFGDHSGGGFGAAARAGGGGGFGAAAAAGGGVVRGASSRGIGGGYQSGDTDAAYAKLCSTIEDELRRLVASVAALKKHVDAVGTSRDSDDLRTKITAAITKGKEAVLTIGELSRRDLAAAVDAVTLSAKERSSRRLQQQRYLSSYKDAVASYTEVATAAQAAERKHPSPPGRGGIVTAGGDGGGKRKGGGVGARKNRNEDDALLRMQQVDFEASLVDEREENITDISSSIMQVNEAFRDLAQIVEDQGHDIAQIDVNVTSAEAHTEEGVGHLEKAEKFQKGYRRWILIMLAIIIVGALGIGAYFLASKLKGGSKS